MRSITRGLLTLAILVGPAIGTAHAITIKEIIQYKSLGGPILISLIEADGSVFHLTAAEVANLKDEGIPDSVILAMIDTAKPKSLRKIVGVPASQTSVSTSTSTADPDSSADQTDLTTAADTQPAPVVVNVTQSQHVSQHVDATPATIEVPVPVAVPVIEHGRRPLPQPQQTQSPQYWGYGGQKRPDSWGPTPAPPTQRNDTKPDPATKGGGSND